MFLGELSVAVAQILADVVAIVHPATGTKRSRQQHSHFCDEMKTTEVMWCVSWTIGQNISDRILLFRSSVLLHLYSWPKLIHLSLYIPVTITIFWHRKRILFSNAHVKDNVKFFLTAFVLPLSNLRSASRALLCCTRCIAQRMRETNRRRLYKCINL